MELGKINRLKVVKRVDFGFYLDGGIEGEILLPLKLAPADCRVGDEIDVFLYLDSEERLIATTEEPKAKVGDFAYLQVAWVNNFGAFLDWGLLKDLFVPFREQKMKMVKGHSYIVHLHIDEASYRIVASAKIERYFSKEKPSYADGDAVSILVWQKTDLGFKVIIDNKYAGLLYDNELFCDIKTGDRMQAYIKTIRPDGKIDVTLHKQGHAAVLDFSEVLLNYLREHEGCTALCDKSPAERIYETFGVSKKVFKKAVGDLYKRRLIEISDQGIKLIS